MELGYNPSHLEGYLVFYSYTFIFRFKTQLRPGTTSFSYVCDIPRMIETFDRRKFARLKFESKENKVITVYNKSFDMNFKGILTDISVSGLGFSVINIDEIPKVGDIILTDIELPGKKFRAIASVVHVREDMVGCIFLEGELATQKELKDIINREIDWRSENLLINLKKREEIIQSLGKQEKTTDNLTVTEMIEKQNAMSPLIDFFISSFHHATGIILAKRWITYKETSLLPYVISMNASINIYNSLVFTCYFSSNREELYKLAPFAFNNKTDGMVVSSSIVLDEIGRKLKAFSDSQEPSKQIFSFGTPRTLETNKRLLSDLSRRPSIDVHFTSAAGDFHLLLMAENTIDAVSACASARAREFVTLEKMDMLEPISFAALKVFSEFLKLEIREKSVTSRDQLLPRFEISIILDIFFNEFEGKVILNLSKKLALKIYELLFNEPVEEFTKEVKDAVAEITNMITGNAKSEFENMGVYYKISTPVVLESREGVAIYARHMKFLSSVYWTSEGFFDLSFSFYKK